MVDANGSGIDRAKRGARSTLDKEGLMLEMIQCDNGVCALRWTACRLVRCDWIAKTQKVEMMNNAKTFEQIRRGNEQDQETVVVHWIACGQ